VPRTPGDGTPGPLLSVQLPLTAPEWYEVPKPSCKSELIVGGKAGDSVEAAAKGIVPVAASWAISRSGAAHPKRLPAQELRQFGRVRRLRPFMVVFGVDRGLGAARPRVGWLSGVIGALVGIAVGIGSVLSRRRRGT